MSQTTIDLVDENPRIAALTDEERRTLLTSTQRSIVIQHLARRNGSTELEDLAATVAARDDTVTAGSENALHRVRILLHHCHLPMMDDMGIIDYESTTHRVST